jgi:hypothetical protein
LLASLRRCVLMSAALLLRRPTLENRGDDESTAWETATTILNCSITGMRYGFIPFIVLYAMKKDPRISVWDVLSPSPSFDPNAQQMMM